MTLQNHLPSSIGVPNTRTLEHGPLRFSALERGQGQLVLCLHGFPDSPRTFRHQLAELGSQHRVLAPTLRGYEPWSQPDDGDYTLRSIASDVVAWLDQLEVERCHLVGHDWGAFIAHVVALIAPERLSSLTTIAVAHPGRVMELARRRPSQVVRSWYMLMFQLPGIAEYVLQRRDWAFVDWLWRSWSPGYEQPAEERAAIKRMLAQPGVERAALAYYRALRPDTLSAHGPLSDLLARPVQVRTLAITGALDGCMHTRLHDEATRGEDFPQGVRVERLENAGHFVHQERPREVNALLRAHFAGG
jgi:pimeloyl-ACP methyl ester carboxylesterase